MILFFPDTEKILETFNSGIFENKSFIQKFHFKHRKLEGKILITGEGKVEAIYQCVTVHSVHSSFSSGFNLWKPWLSKRMNFWKSFKRPLTPFPSPFFWNEKSSRFTYQIYSSKLCLKCLALLRKIWSLTFIQYEWWWFENPNLIDFSTCFIFIVVSQSDEIGRKRKLCER